MRMFLCTKEPLILTRKLLLTALKSVISSPQGFKSSLHETVATEFFLKKVFHKIFLYKHKMHWQRQ